MTDLSKGRILVTGGAGLIGSALICELNRRGVINILVSDFLGNDERWKNLAPLKFVDYMEADDLLARCISSPQMFNDVRTIFHLGACSSTTELNAAYLIRNNFEYTKQLAHLALETGRRFIYASSAATYGSIAQGVTEMIPLSGLRPLNMYGYSKHLFDCYAERTGILPFISGIKYFNIFGPNEHHKGNMRSVVHKAFHEIQQTGSVSLFKSYNPQYSDGGQKRDFLYVKDAVLATIFLAESVAGGGLFNVGSGISSTWLSLVEPIFRALKRDPKVLFIEMPEYLRDKYQYCTSADIGKLRDAGFDSTITPLADAVTDYVANYLIPGRYLGDAD